LTEWIDGVLKSHNLKVVSVDEVTISCWLGWVQVCVSSWSWPKKSSICVISLSLQRKKNRPRPTFAVHLLDFHKELGILKYWIWLSHHVLRRSSWKKTSSNFNQPKKWNLFVCPADFVKEKNSCLGNRFKTDKLGTFLVALKCYFDLNYQLTDGLDQLSPHPKVLPFCPKKLLQLVSQM